MSSSLSMPVCQPAPASPRPHTRAPETRAHRLTSYRERLLAGLTTLLAPLHRRRPSRASMAEPRERNQISPSELARRLPLLPMGF
jgi:hypothetical protein